MSAVKEPTLREMILNKKAEEIAATNAFLDAMFDSIQTGTLDLLNGILQLDDKTAIERLSWYIQATSELLLNLPFHIEQRKKRYPTYEVDVATARNVFTDHREMFAIHKRAFAPDELRRSIEEDVVTPANEQVRQLAHAKFTNSVPFKATVAEKMDPDVYNKTTNGQIGDMSNTMVSGPNDGCNPGGWYGVHGCYYHNHPSLCRSKEEQNSYDDADDNMMAALLNRMGDADAADIDAEVYNKHATSDNYDEYYGDQEDKAMLNTLLSRLDVNVNNNVNTEKNVNSEKNLNTETTVNTLPSELLDIEDKIEAECKKYKAAAESITPNAFLGANLQQSSTLHPAITLQQSSALQQSTSTTLPVSTTTAIPSYISNSTPELVPWIGLRAPRYRDGYSNLPSKPYRETKRRVPKRKPKYNFDDLEYLDKPDMNEFQDTREINNYVMDSLFQYLENEESQKVLNPIQTLPPRPARFILENEALRKEQVQRVLPHLEELAQLELNNTDALDAVTPKLSNESLMKRQIKILRAHQKKRKDEYKLIGSILKSLRVLVDNTHVRFVKIPDKVTNVFRSLENAILADINKRVAANVNSHEEFCREANMANYYAKQQELMRTLEIRADNIRTLTGDINYLQTEVTLELYKAILESREKPTRVLSGEEL